MGEPIKCTLVASFAARQAIIMAAVLLFVLYTWIQIRRGVEKRSLTTLVADASKQAGQQAFGGAMMVVLGVLLAHHKYDSLAWYAAEYPFEVILTTYLTGSFRKWTESGFTRWYERSHAAWLEPYTKFGMYAPLPGEFRWNWYGAQMVQAVLLIGIPARVVSILAILLSLHALPEWMSPVDLVARAWYVSGLSCAMRTLLSLYCMPVLGDALQFVIVDQLQKFKAREHDPRLLDTLQ